MGSAATEDSQPRTAPDLVRWVKPIQVAAVVVITAATVTAAVIGDYALAVALPVGPAIVAGVPAVLSRRYRGEVAEVSAAWTHPAVFTTVAAVGATAGLYGIAAHQALTAAVLGWMLAVVVLCNCLGLIMSLQFHLPAASPAARRAMTWLAWLMLGSLFAWAGALAPVQNATPAIGQVLLSAMTAASVLAVLVLMPRRPRRAQTRLAGNG